jgi:hypothetical protein
MTRTGSGESRVETGGSWSKAESQRQAKGQETQTSRGLMLKALQAATEYAAVHEPEAILLVHSPVINIL